MESSRVILLPVAPEPADHVLPDMVAAIDLVAGGGARRVVLAGLVGVEAVAPEALAHAQAAHVRFALARVPDGVPTVVIGPVEA